MARKKEKLPVDFLTSTISDCWDEVGKLQSSMDGIKETFTGTEKVDKILQDLLDAYLVCIGQLEAFVDNKNYLEMPEVDEKELKEHFKLTLKESNEEEAVPYQAKRFQSGGKTEVFTDLPNYDVEVEQKGDKVEIELEPKDECEECDDEICDDECCDEDDCFADNTFCKGKNCKQTKQEFMDDMYATYDTEPNNLKSESPEYFVTDFPEPEENPEIDSEIQAWLNRSRN